MRYFHSDGTSDAMIQTPRLQPGGRVEETSQECLGVVGTTSRRDVINTRRIVIDVKCPFVGGQVIIGAGECHW